MTSTTVSISWGMIVLGLLACAAAGFAMFVALAALLGRIFSRPVVACERSHVRWAVGVFAVTAIVAIAATKGLRARSLTIESSSDEIVSTHEALSELSKARQEAQNAVRETKIAVSDLHAALTESGEMIVVSAPQAAVETVQEPQPATPAQAPAQPEAPKADPPVAPATQTESTTAAEPAPQPEVHPNPAEDSTEAKPEDRKDNVADLIRSLLSHGTTAVRPDASTASKAEGAPNQDGMMLLEMSPEDASAMFAGPEMLSRLNAQLPEGVKVAYALVPLTAPVDSAVAPVKPLLAAGSLQTLADQMVTLLEPFRSQPTADAAPKSADTEPSASSSSSDVTVTEPAWLKKPDGGRITVQSRPIFDGDNRDQALADAISEAYQSHATEHFQTLDPALVSMVKRVDLRLDDSAVKLCLVEKPFPRKEQAKFGQEGEKPFEIIYALVQFPEAVDKAAESKIRHAMQKDRLLALGLAVGFGWASILSIGGSIRMWTRRTGLKRFVVSLPFAGLAAVMMLGTVSVIVAASTGDGPQVSSSLEEPLVISVASPDKA